MLDWLPWSASAIAKILTKVCEPYVHLRAWEFDIGKADPNLKHLLEMGASLSHFVTSTILVATVKGQKVAVEVYKAWADVSLHLLKLGNFHLLQSVYMGLSRNQVERIPWLEKRLTSSMMKHRSLLDALFDPKDQYTKIGEMYHARIMGSKAVVICLPFLAQQALLLKESPLLLDNGKRINLEHLQASVNIFKILTDSQKHWYSKELFATNDEQQMWYFLQLASTLKKQTRTAGDQDNDLYILSDAARQRKTPLSLKIKSTSIEDALEAVSGSKEATETKKTKKYTE